MKLRASYTIEAAMIMSICFIFFGAAISVTYKVFADSFEYVRRETVEIDSVKLFRDRQSFSDIFEVLEKEK